MNDEFLQWLREQLDDDERTARAAHAPNWSTDGRRGLHYGVEDGWMTDALTTADADHIARHDPARVLREIDAKRELFAIHRSEPNPDWDRPGVDGRSCTRCITQYPCPTLRLLALPYAALPGYRDEWRP